jgi:protein required for attachment to host cells
MTASVALAKQATTRIGVLEKMALADDQPRMEGPNLTVQVERERKKKKKKKNHISLKLFFQMETESDWNFADKKAFESTFASELDAFSEFVKR